MVQVEDSIDICHSGMSVASTQHLAVKQKSSVHGKHEIDLET